MNLIDSHAHLDFPVFQSSLNQVIQQAQAQGVQRCVIAGVKSSTWHNLWQVATEQPSCYASLGLHPYFLAAHQPADLILLAQQLEQLSGEPKLCALGEIGLDFQLENPNKELQEFYFIEQLKLAQQFNLPVIVHVRKAHARVIELLKLNLPARGGVIHAFNGSYEQAQEYKRLGFFLGIGGAYTWPQAVKLRALLPRLDRTQLVLETDSPDMPPAFAPTKPNMPVNLAGICQALAPLLHLTPSELAAQTTANACRLFNWAQV